MGPGAKSGLGRIFGNVSDRSDLTLTRLVRDLARATSGFASLGLDFPALLGDDVSLKNIEHGLCEFDKYWRSVLGQGVRERFFFGTPVAVERNKCLLCDREVRLRLGNLLAISIGVLFSGIGGEYRGETLPDVVP